MTEGAYTVSAPGRICLFGEHQYYLGLPVIAAAITRRFRIDVKIEDPSLHRYRILLPDLGREEIIDLARPIVYGHGKDYLRSCINMLREAGFELPRALTATMTSKIPIAAGTSSSSALTVAWIASLLHGAGHKEAADPLTVARLAHRSEVIAFDERGGMMDQLSIAFGGICHFDFAKDHPTEPLQAIPQGFVLGDSCQPKDTQAILSRVRDASEGAINRCKTVIPAFDLKTTPQSAVEAADLAPLSKEEKAFLLGNLRNRDYLKEAHVLLSRDRCDPELLGRLLNAHHEILRDVLRISTPKVEAMIKAARAAGALGGKINGSGGGGCLFVLAPGRQEEVAEAMRTAGGRAWPVEVARGVRISDGNIT
ncbi:MAG: GHMP kinase [Planctomycetes bacterium]|nr:GHMP kinase [Planctomycetota bacterium]